jgi:YegS C-terminal NAD kinase beta sandwich-like domain
VSIRRGEAWGESGPLPAGGIVVSTDAAARHAVEDAMRAGQEPPPIGLLGGDLCTTLGGRGDHTRLGRDDAARLRVDIGHVIADDDHEYWFVAHLVARRSWWRGRIVAVMNAAWIGRWNVAPRAHPGDGLFDVLDADLSLADRLKARPRLALGTHVPHPDIAVRRSNGFDLDLAHPTPVALDGDRVVTATRLRVDVIPDALAVVI